MKKIFNMKWIALLFVAVLSLGFVSCGDDDDDNTPQNSAQQSASLVGTWFYEGDGYTITLVFNNNGTGTFTEEYSDGSQYTEKFEYVYDANEKELSVVGKDAFDGTYDVLVTSSTLRLTQYGSTSQYKRK